MKRFSLFFIFNFSSYCLLIAQIYVNPVKKNLADPYIYYENGQYYAYGTDYSWAGFWVYKSTDLVNWDSGHECLNKSKGNFGTDNFWAPEVIKKGDYYYMFYAADYGLCVSRSSSPEGPFYAWGSNKGSLRTNAENQGQWAIDPHYFKDNDGKEYLYYARVGGYGIWVAELSDDFTNISNDTFCFSEISQREDWVFDDKELTNEAPFLIKKNGTYFLFYSGNGWCDHYSVGYATAHSPKGPWVKYNANPIIKEKNGQTNVGGASIIFSPDATQLYLIYHRDVTPNIPCGARDMCIDSLNFKNGVWSIPAGPSNSANPYPSSNNRITQTVSFDSIPDLNLKDSLSWKLSAKSSSGNKVNFRIEKGPAIIKNDTLFSVGQVGKIAIIAYQIGDTTVTESEVSRNLFITTNFAQGGIIKYAVNSGNTTQGYRFFSPDLYYTGGNCWTLKKAPDTTGVIFPADVEVYKTIRYGNSFSYFFDRLKANKNYLVRFHFQDELFAVEGCSDNIIVNQQTILSNYKILETVGPNKAIIKEFIVKSTNQGEIKIDFTTANKNAIISGIEIIENGNFTSKIESVYESPLSIFPNPLSKGENLKIEINSLNIGDRINIFNQLGQEVYNIKLNKANSVINPNLPTGIYIIQLIDNGKDYYQKLIVK
ncbi:MAG: family 43 glycosylhydrolase [Bacteroidales bacterium]|nr:family 43 glycosylhydrolase [Bacteroidales bacterium]